MRDCVQRRQRARLKAALARNNRDRRERARELRQATEQDHPAVEAMRFRHALRDASDVIRALRVLHEDGKHRVCELGPVVFDALAHGGVRQSIALRRL